MGLVVSLSEAKNEIARAKQIANAEIYIVGAGQYGDFLGEYFNKKGIAWQGYIDGKATGVLNEKPINRYEDIRKDAFFIISSIPYRSEMRKRLVDLGVSEERIIDFAYREIIFDLYAEVNSLMAELREGACQNVSYGEKDPDKTYAVLQIRIPYEGIFSCVHSLLRMFRYIEERGYVPVVDFWLYPMLCSQNADMWAIENSWEYYYKQPGGVSIEYVHSGCKNVKIFNVVDYWNMTFIGGQMHFTKNGISNLVEWNRVLLKYFHLTDTLEKELYDSFRELFPCNGDKICGVAVREGYMTTIASKRKGTQLHLQPALDMLVEKLKESMEEWGYQYVFLMCETVETIKSFEKSFGNALVIYNRDRKTKSKEKGWHGIFADREEDRVKKTKSYIIETYLLSKCDAFIGGINGGTWMANLLNGGKYEHTLILDEGFYNA